MKAINITGKHVDGRVNLAGLLPLSTPLVVEIFPIYACNFKCRYCMFSVPEKNRGFVSSKDVMDFDMYEKCIVSMLSFPQKIKVLRFAGMGEPLLHRNIEAMINYATFYNVAEKIELITNASLLTPKLSDALIASGLSRMVISIQGTSAEKYKEISGINLDFKYFLSNIKYLYKHKKNMEIYIKILDYALDDKEKFYEIFGDICNYIGIEHAVPIYPDVDYNIFGDVPFTQFGSFASDVQICPRPFATMYILPDGKVTPCYSMDYPEIMGDLNTESIYEIWGGKKFRAFQYNMLNGIKNEVCSDCNMIKHRFCKEDDLSKDVERLKKFYGGD